MKASAILRSEDVHPAPNAHGRTARPRRRLPKSLKWALGAILALAALVVLGSFFVDEPIRRSIERQMNQRLTGYSVRLLRAHFQLFGLSVTLSDLTISQKANPEPPVAFIPRLHASVQWRELLSGHLVGDVLFEKPKVYLNLPQLLKEAKDKTPIEDRGWQQALQAVYPLKINLLRIDDGQIQYIDMDPSKPLRLSRVNLRASNIRNIHSREHVYPSPIYAEARVFDSGHLVVDGHADFLAEPFPGIHILSKFENIPLEAVRSPASRAHFDIRGGILSGSGELEYAAKIQLVHLQDLMLSGVRLDYIATAPAAPAVKPAAADAAVAAVASKGPTKETPSRTFQVDQFRLIDAEVGFVNKTKSPSYRVFLTKADAQVTNLSNDFRQGPGTGRLRGLFMGNGVASAQARFRPAQQGPDFDLNVAIEKTDMTTMNDLLRAYGKFDVARGIFSFYSEVHVQKGVVSGYVKPLFEDMKVYDSRQDAEKSVFRKMYEGLVGGIAKLLENKERGDVATKTEISGTVGNIRSNTWQTIARLIENAFFKAILPGFDRAIPHSKA